jgi:hypothetical protein
VRLKQYRASSSLLMAVDFHGWSIQSLEVLQPVYDHGDMVLFGHAVYATFFYRALLENLYAGKAFTLRLFKV